MRFDSFKSVKPVAQYLHLRDPEEGESLEDYRCFVADHDPDIVEAIELINGRPWDECSPWDNLEMLSLMVQRNSATRPPDAS